MKLFDKLERLEQGIGRTVGFSKGFGTFAKADVANRIRTSMDDASYVDQGGHTMAPNIFNVRFSSADFSRVREWGNPFAVELCNLAISHARAQGYSLIGAVRITFSPIADLEADEFEVVPSFEAFRPLPRVRRTMFLPPVPPTAPPTTPPLPRLVIPVCRPELQNRGLLRRAARNSLSNSNSRHLPRPRRNRVPRRILRSSNVLRRIMLLWILTGSGMSFLGHLSSSVAAPMRPCGWLTRVFRAATYRFPAREATMLPPTWAQPMEPG